MSGRRARLHRESASSIARTSSTAASCRRWRTSDCSASACPQQYGGAGMDYLALGIASEELEYVDTSLRVILSVHAGLNCLTLLSWGTEDQKQRYLVPQAQGKKIADLRPDRAVGGQRRARHPVGRDQEGRSLPAHRREDVDLARRRRRQLPRVRAGRDLEKKKQRDPAGISAFIVERAFKGFSSGTLKEKWGILAGNTGFFKMDEVEVPQENLVGREGEGFKIAMFALDQGRYTVAAGATGLIRACRDASVSYAKQRKTFGVEIGSAPAREGNDRADGVGLPGVASAVDARGLARRTSAAATRARPGSRNGSRRSRRSAPPATPCRFTAPTAIRTNIPVGRFYRNCKGAVIYEGTREIHKLMQADYVLGYRSDRPTRCELPPSRSRRIGARTLDARFRSLARLPARRRTGGDRLRAHDGTGRPAQVGSRRRRGDAPGDGHRADRRHDRHRRGRARRGADALHRREGRHGEQVAERPPVSAGRHRRRSARRNEPLRDGRAERDRRCSRRRKAADCSMRRTCYMEKLVVGPSSRDVVDLDAPVRFNLRAIAAGARPARRGPRRDRPRSARATRQLIAEIRATGARIRLIGDGDLSAGIAAAVVGSGVHAVMGIGGAPEGVLTAAAMRCLNGEIFAPAGDRQARSTKNGRARDGDHAISRRSTARADLAPGKSLIFAATGVTEGSLMKGVRASSATARGRRR